MQSSIMLSVCMSCLLFAPPVEAATIKEFLAHCRAKDKDTERLACYDELARAVAEGVVLPPLPDSGTGQWEVHQEISPIDDSRNVYMSLAAEDVVDASGLLFAALAEGLAAEDVVDARALRRLSHPSLWVRCMENETAVFIGYPSSLRFSSLDEDITVLTRFDRHPAQESRWSLSTDKKAIFAPAGVSWARKIADAQKLFVRVTPPDGSPVDATFHLTGSAEAMRPLRESCSWEDAEPDPPLEEEMVEEVELEEEEEIVELWRVEKKPVIIKKIKPNYPATNITGKVFVTALVGKDGKVEQIGKITGPKVFHEVARAAALQSEFTPAMQNDRPIKVWVSLPFTFRKN